MLTRLLICFGLISLFAYLVVMTYIYFTSGWTVLGGVITTIVFGIAAWFRWPALLVPMTFVGLSSFYGMNPLLAGTILVPMLALSSIIVKGILLDLVTDFYRNKTHLENRPSHKF